jgi:hypothetical protein
MRSFFLSFLAKVRQFWFTPLLEGQKRYSKYQSLRALAYNHAVQDTFSEFREEIEKSMIFEKFEIRSFCCEQIRRVDPMQVDHLLLEFGVFRGKSIKFFAKQCPDHHFVGFDSFEGLYEDWTGTSSPQRAFDQKGIAPAVRKNVTLITGIIDQTLPSFLEGHSGRDIFFIHVDTDTYEVAHVILSCVKSRLIEGSIILFDELHSYPGWRQGEYRALTEVLPRKSYEFLAFSQKRAVIRIIRPSLISDS